MKVAVTSQNLKTVTAHAGKARKFIIFDVSPAVGAVETDRLELPKEMSVSAYHGEDPHPLSVFDGLVTGGCGEGFHRRMASMGVRLSVTDELDPARAAEKAVAQWDSAA